MSRSMTPKELAGLADEYNKTRQERLAADKAAALLKSKEENLKLTIIASMQEQELTAIGGQTVRLELPLEPDYVPHVTDWNVLWAFMVQQHDFSLVERRPSRAAMKERWEANVEVPGVEKFPVYKLSVHQVKG